jgi:hypothetical protein
MESYQDADQRPWQDDPVDAQGQVLHALEMLLAHDDDEALFDTPFLCIRLRKLQIAGHITSDEMYVTRRHIGAKIYPHHLTLAELHLNGDGYKADLLVNSDEWPAIRREYLKQWIQELS